MPILSPRLLSDVLQIAETGGEYLRDFYTRSVQVQLKADNTPVTEADLFMSQFLSEKLTALTPDIPILSEESGHISVAERQQWPIYWLIDPLDGTQQFIERTGQFGILIALVQHNCPVLGLIHMPILQQTCYAIRGQGAYKKDVHGVQRLVPQPLDRAQRIKIAVGDGKMADKVRSILHKNIDYEFQIFGSSSLKSLLVAEGTSHCYVRLGNTGEWDTAAAEVILQEMGGGIFDPNFAPLTYNQRDTLINPHFVMTGCRQADWRQIFCFDNDTFR
ncbi:3'(2'),5'-bisphosphate nucleotidase CysQ [Conservatibacter flavescens]|uniref:3'(2'),5'-bisphosphate nucleotidase CysQ n=1 Tax=Conservatibacter flavescens TaxID=28161 RepID=A0A2M8S1B2_9PAST|nr:3'(2'),5'-bisphosphate nucleotidase CysQ [Conservatibacter flavescens]PJG84927.1 3'(2'),5'-bisphosphate nucleotidase [Conservatibacter flavescens]